MALINEYFDLTKKYINEYGEKTILLMQVGSFFEVYGKLNKDNKYLPDSKIQDFYQICELNISSKKCFIGSLNNKEKYEIMMAGVNVSQLDKYVKKLLDAGYTIPVHTQDINAKNTTRSLLHIFSPGTYFTTENNRLTNNTCCIWLYYSENNILSKGKTLTIGIANIDIYTGKTNLYQVTEPYKNNPTTYDELERFISIYQPSEVILISNIPNETEFHNVIEYANIQTNLLHIHHIPEIKSPILDKIKNCEKQIYQIEVLRRFYPKFDETYDFHSFHENEIATQAFCYLLDFIYKHNQQLVNKINEPIFETISQKLLLANHTLKQLNMIDDGSGKSSVTKILNKCITPLGKREFHFTLLYPTYDVDYLQKEYDITEHYLTSAKVSLDALKEILSEIKDLSKWERQVYTKKIPPKTFNQLYSNMKSIQKLYDIIKKDQYTIDYLEEAKIPFSQIYIYSQNIIDTIHSYINLDLAENIEQTTDFDINFIRSGIFPELDEKTSLYQDSYDKIHAIKDYLHTVLSKKEKTKHSADFIKLNETEKHNLYLSCTSRRTVFLEDLLPIQPETVMLNFGNNKTFPFIISKTQFRFEKQSSSDKSANCYITDEQIDNICNTIYKIKNTMKELITNEYNKFLAIFENHLIELEHIISLVIRIDMIYAKATIAKTFHYCKPQIDNNSKKSFINTKGLRHCLIEQLQLTNEVYVSNDITLGTEGTDGILLYGTNAVGKTCFIKSIGIAILLAQAGLYVPCKEMIYKPYHHIFTRIIGNDNLFKGLSTFAVEMLELRTILRLSDENSLILGDELCSGTETLSAISIFVAGIQELHRKKSSFIFATHLHEVVNFDEIHELDTLKMKHMSVVYDREKDELIYDRKLLDGPGNNMYGLEVCKSLHLPDNFIKNAYDIREKYMKNTNVHLLDLKTSHFNAKKIMSICESCGKNKATEIHHLFHQKEANENEGFIEREDFVMHKNNIANLIALCDTCHNKIHKSLPNGGGKRVRKVKL